MGDFIVHVDEVGVPMQIGPDITDITAELARIVRDAGVSDGALNAISVGSTGSLTSIEYEPGVVADLCRAVSRLAARDDHYEHEQAWHDGNGHSHVQAALLGPSIAVPIKGGKLQLGTWQQVVLINHDNCSRTRQVAVTVMGTTA